MSDDCRREPGKTQYRSIFLSDIHLGSRFGYWSLSGWVKHRVKRAVSFISEFEEAVTYQCRKQGYQGVVCGHIHHAEIRDLDGTRYLNCGYREIRVACNPGKLAA